jgi:hypothetical protein
MKMCIRSIVTKHVTPDDNELFSFTEQLADQEENV